MSKAKSFRSRKVDAKRPLPVYRASEIPDLDEGLNAQRAVPIIETGVEKEEETEHHLQVVISAAQTNSAAAKQVYIPTPDASRLAPDYEELYRPVFHRPHTYIRFSSTVEECGCVGYIMDDEDKRWFDDWLANQAANAPTNTGNTTSGTRRGGTPSRPVFDEDMFEDIMDVLEDLADRHVGVENWSFDQVESALQNLTARPNAARTRVLAALVDIPHAVQATLEHWQRRRKALPPGRTSIMPRLKTEDRSQKETDPFVCFRRRELRPIRKTRRSDAQSLAKLRQLRAELHQACHLLELVDRREKMRRESLMLEQLCFDQKMIMRDLRKRLGYKNEADGLYHIKKVKKIDGRLGSSGVGKMGQRGIRDGIGAGGHHDELALRSSAIAMAMGHDEQFIKRVDAELQQRRARDMGWRDITEDPFQPFPLTASEQKFRSLHQRSTQQYRRRVGRGGRIFLDRRITRPLLPSLPTPDLYGSTDQMEELERLQRLSERLRYDNDIQDSWHETWSNSMAEDTNYLSYRANLLTPTDLQQIGTIPWLETHPQYMPHALLSSTSFGTLYAHTPASTTMQEKNMADNLQGAIGAQSNIALRSLNTDTDLTDTDMVSTPLAHKRPRLSTGMPTSSIDASSSAEMSSPMIKSISGAANTSRSPHLSPSAVVNANRSMGALMLTPGDALARSMPGTHGPSTPQATSTSNPFESTSSTINSPLNRSALPCHSPMLNGTSDNSLSPGSALNMAVLSRKKRPVKLQSVSADVS